uniref:NADH-ubiquinone oxidoreductase chain 3 n=1 Tax=Meranoplus bicolor TaxID=611886 RepID=A0A8K1RCQ9_9HYME|nr:NADH dehydrogenase subunit 3 [Meranoplus bicolor]
MAQLMLLLYLFYIISFMLIIINMLISKKSFQDREKLSPFECGFDPMSKTHMPFSVHFFLISLIFLIFDIEITILIPMIYLFKYFNLHMIYTLILIMLTLVLGLYIEYLEQSMDWKI